ncbi:hypothetical protein BDR04DRAFT_998886 [Suillus decipiens]|nr:hypothetical protein BDR04DRAFT_998886 [Suillus decipiens]
MYGKFNITKLGRRDQILLGIPWLHAMNLVIDWTAKTLALSRTKKLDMIEIDTDTDRKKAKLLLLFYHLIPKMEELLQSYAPILFSLYYYTLSFLQPIIVLTWCCHVSLFFPELLCYAYLFQIHICCPFLAMVHVHILAYLSTMYFL